MDLKLLYQQSYQTLLNLASDEGINASGKDEVFGCLFGRDSAITILKILRSNQRQQIPFLLEICQKTLLNLASLQGQEFNLESGEQPGKFIHEFRKSRFEHLTSANPPWYLYPDQILRNYDSLDSTPLTLIALYKYWQATLDDQFLVTILPAVEAGINWLITYGDLDKDGLVEYELSSKRKFGGLSVQSWTDSHESLINKTGHFPKYPIAPIEVQAYSWLALKLWGDYYLSTSPKFGKKLLSQALRLKKQFNRYFLLKDQGFFFGAQALDGKKQQIKTITGSPLLCLWASFTKNGKTESILESEFISDFVKRAFLPDLFLEDAGIRTMSTLSPTFNPNRDSYHNGSFWPMLNGLIVEGLENFGFFQEANQLKTASLAPIAHFKTPIELYIKDSGGYSEYCNSEGQTSCKQQAWSAAAILDMAVDSNINLE